jgi:hypothetical protein
LRGAFARIESLTARIYGTWRTDPFTLLLSESIAAEVESVLSRPAAQAGWFLACDFDKSPWDDLKSIERQCSAVGVVGPL